jgi:hypothetical protein
MFLFKKHYRPSWHNFFPAQLCFSYTNYITITTNNSGVRDFSDFKLKGRNTLNKVKKYF